jgi:predicted DNA-binding transcriptional regulator AlpA
MESTAKNIGPGEDRPDKVSGEELLCQLAAAVATGNRDEVFHLAARLVAAAHGGDRSDPLTLAEVAKKMRVSTRTLWRVLGSDKAFPKPFRVGRSLRWRRADIENFKAQPDTRR